MANSSLKVNAGAIIAAGSSVDLWRLIKIEDGTGVTGATSYVTRVEYIAYAAAQGTTIPDTVASDQELVKAARFIDSIEDRLQGERVLRDQALAFPRRGLSTEGWTWEYTEIPTQLETAQMELALYFHAGKDPYNPDQNKITSRERVEGAVDVSYQVGSGKQYESKSWDFYLSQLCNNLSSIVMVRA